MNMRLSTIYSDFAVTIAVTSCEEGLGLSISQCPGTSGEGLQEQSGNIEENGKEH